MKNFELFFLLSFFIEGVFGESLSVKEGDSVTLHTGLTDIRSGKDDVLDWRFGAGSDLIARVRKDSDPTTEDDDLGGIFRGRLKPDRQTADLTITNIKTEHAGPYEISINDTNKMFSVIVVPAGPVKTVSVMVGDSVTLNTGDPKPQRDDVIKWRFKNSSIAEINGKTRNAFTSYTTDEGFRDRLQLDYWTGSLTIRNTETKHSGDYEYDISISSHTIHRLFTVTVSVVTGELKSAQSVMKGESAILNSGLTEIQTDDLMQWRFRDSQIAEFIKGEKKLSTSDGLKDRLKLDHQTGSLTITDTRFTDAGLYELKISNIRRTVLKSFTVTVTDPGLSTAAIVGIVVVVLLVCVAAAAGVIYHRHKISKLKARIYTLRVFVGEDITLNPYDEIHNDDRLQWMFRSSCIAVRESAVPRFTVHDHLPDGRFGGRLELDHQTGSLTITNTIPTHSGLYELQIIRSGKISINRFSVAVFLNIPRENEPLNRVP